MQITPDKIREVLDCAECIHDFKAIENALDKLAREITEKLKETKIGTKVIIITRPVECEHLKLYHTKKCNFG